MRFSFAFKHHCELLHKAVALLIRTETLTVIERRRFPAEAIPPPTSEEIASAKNAY